MEPRQIGFRFQLTTTKVLLGTVLGQNKQVSFKCSRVLSNIGITELFTVMHYGRPTVCS